MHNISYSLTSSSVYCLLRIIIPFSIPAFKELRVQWKHMCLVCYNCLYTFMWVLTWSVLTAYFNWKLNNTVTLKRLGGGTNDGTHLVPGFIRSLWHTLVSLCACSLSPTSPDFGSSVNSVSILSNSERCCAKPWSLYSMPNNDKFEDWDSMGLN